MVIVIVIIMVIIIFIIIIMVTCMIIVTLVSRVLVQYPTALWCTKPSWSFLALSLYLVILVTALKMRMKMLKTGRREVARLWMQGASFQADDRQPRCM